MTRTLAALICAALLLAPSPARANDPDGTNIVEDFILGALIGFLGYGSVGGANLTALGASGLNLADLALNAPSSEAEIAGYVGGGLSLLAGVILLPLHGACGEPTDSGRFDCGIRIWGTLSLVLGVAAVAIAGAATWERLKLDERDFGTSSTGAALAPPREYVFSLAFPL